MPPGPFAGISGIGTTRIGTATSEGPWYHIRYPTTYRQMLRHIACARDPGQAAAAEGMSTMFFDLSSRLGSSLA